MVHLKNMNADVKSEFDRFVSFISKMDGVLYIYLFGSYAYGEPNECSDIDLLVIVRDDINTLKMMQKISFGLCDRQLSLDVVAERISDFMLLSKGTRNNIQKYIKEQGVLVYGDS
jgi:predicted nucleotidyltransferase